MTTQTRDYSDVESVKEFYEGLNHFYGMFVKAKERNEKLEPNTKGYLKLFCKEAMKIPFYVRREFEGFDQKLEEMLNDPDLAFKERHKSFFYATRQSVN